MAKFAQLEFSRSSSADHRGATSIEYALLAALIAGVIVIAVGLFGGSVQGLFEFNFPG